MATQDLTKQRSKTRRHLMNAAIQLILEEGYDKVTVTAIADVADYGRWVFYQYFKDKEDITWAILSQWFIRTNADVVDSVQHLESPEREHTAWKLMVGHYIQHRPFFRQLGSARQGDLGRKMRNLVIQQFANNLKNNHLSLMSALPPEIASSMHIGSVFELIIQYANSPDDAKLDLTSDDIFRYIFNQEPPHNN